MSDQKPSLSVRLLAGALMLLVVLASLEIAIGAAAAIKPNLFGQGAELHKAIDTIDDQAFRSFAARAKGHPAVWDNPPGKSTTQDCVGRTVTATYDESGSRVFPGYDGKAATVIITGDSFTQGAEANDDEAVGAHLHRGHGIMAANLGVGGYSPLQAVLKLEARAREFPSAKTAILGVMFENIRRNVNSNNAILSGIVSALGVRPYVRDGEIRMVPREIFDDIASFKAYAKRELDLDYWYTPSARFPYTLSFVRLATSNSFLVQNKSRIMKAFRQQYAFDYSDPELSRALALVLDKFADVAKAAGLKPYVVFFPYNLYDLQSPTRWIADYRAAHRGDLDVSMMDLTGIDWSRYNLGNANAYCHPSPYGYEMIARGYAKVLLKGQAEGLPLQRTGTR